MNPSANMLAWVNQSKRDEISIGRRTIRPMKKSLMLRMVVYEAWKSSSAPHLITYDGRLVLEVALDFI
jgi:hypothetical protein